MVLSRLNKLLLLSTCSLFAANISNSVSNINTLTLGKGVTEISLEYQKLDDNIDFLNIKEKEFSNTNIGSIGDLDGLELNIRYGITSNLEVNYNRNYQEIKYSSSTLANTRDDIFLRYNFLQNKNKIFNSGVSLDFGFVMNRLDDLCINDLDAINRVLKNSSVQITKNNDSYSIPNSTTADPNDSLTLTQTPYALLKDTKDMSYYLRVVTGFHNKKSFYDFYIMYKQTKIDNFIDTSFSNETKTIKDEIVKQGESTNKTLDRDEKMLAIGFNINQRFRSIAYELNYEYDRFLRDDGLDYINTNHLLNLTLLKGINKNFTVYLGGKLMYRQFNGQIPYLYNTYSQTTYDHKYGYARLGLKYTF